MCLNFFLTGTNFRITIFLQNKSMEEKTMDEVLAMLETLNKEQLNEFISFLLKLRDSEDSFLLPASCSQEENQTNL